MSTEADKKALNVQRVQKSVAKKLAQMNDEEKNEYKIKKKEINQKGQANFVANEARLADEAFKAAVAEGAQVLLRPGMKKLLQLPLVSELRPCLKLSLKQTGNVM